MFMFRGTFAAKIIRRKIQRRNMKISFNNKWKRSEGLNREERTKVERV